MKYFWIFFILLLLLMAIGAWLCNKFICGLPIAGAANCAAWEVKDGSHEIFDIDQNVNFRRSNYRHLTSYTDVNAAIDQVANYLKGNNDRFLTITGLYDTLENNTHNLLPNLGLARADDVKSWLESKQVPSNQLDIDHRITDDNCYQGDTLRRGIELAFGDKVSNASRLAAIKDRLFGKPMMLYFATGSDTPNITAQHRQDFADLFYYLDNVSGSKLDVDGHTDNAGNLAANMTLSQSRADDVKNYIMTNGGVPLTSMDTNGFGPNQPIAPNDTPDNKARNRRVEVTLK